MKAHAHRWRGLSIGGAALFVGLGVLVFVVGLLPGDSSLYDEVMAHRTPDIITFFTWVNVFGSWKGLLPAALLLFVISPEARKRWWLVVIVLLAAPIVEQTAKYVVGRPRPRGKAFGFPSGHMTGAASFAVIAIYFAIKERVEPGHANGPHRRGPHHGLPRRARPPRAARPLAVGRPRRSPPRLLVRGVRGVVGREAEPRLMRPFVELEGVGVSYGEVRVLDGINLTVEPGDFLGIIGPNGSGKTTLLRVMLGLLEPTARDRCGSSASRPPRFASGGGWATCPSAPLLDPALPVHGAARWWPPGSWRASASSGASGGRERDAHRRRCSARSAWRRMRGARIGALSTGQQQRVLIARALGLEPRAAHPGRADGRRGSRGADELLRPAPAPESRARGHPHPRQPRYRRRRQGSHQARLPQPAPHLPRAARAIS